MISKLIKFTVKNLGLVLAISGILFTMSMDTITESMAIIASICIIIPVVVIYMIVEFSDGLKPNPILVRLVRNDVLLGLMVILFSMGSASGLIDHF